MDSQVPSKRLSGTASPHCGPLGGCLRVAAPRTVRGTSWQGLQVAPCSLRRQAPVWRVAPPLSLERKASSADSTTQMSGSRLYQLALAASPTSQALPGDPRWGCSVPPRGPRAVSVTQQAIRSCTAPGLVLRTPHSRTKPRDTAHRGVADPGPPWAAEVLSVFWLKTPQPGSLRCLSNCSDAQGARDARALAGTSHQMHTTRLELVPTGRALTAPTDRKRGRTNP